MDSGHEALTAAGITWRLLAVVVLVAANGFFVAAEFALVAARRSRIDRLAAQGSATAKAVQDTLRHLDRYIAGTQLGITLASLALGWIGEATLATLVARGLDAAGLSAPGVVTHGAAAIAIAFLVITFLHIVFGELAPKSLALAKPEPVSMWVARPLRLFSRVMSPFLFVLNGAANRFLRLFGLETVSESAHVHSPEELRLLVMQTHAHGLLDESDRAMLAGVFDFHNKRVRDVMRPRTEIAAIPLDATEEQTRELVRQERYSRFPVFDGTLDNVVGILIAKDLYFDDGAAPFTVQRFMREALYVPDSRPAERVMDDLRRTRAQMAVVLDEYGGTAGLVTMEDLVEEIVGDIADEYDIQAREAVEVGGMLELAGSLSLVDVRSDHAIPVPEGNWTTLGGFVFARLGRLPKVGDRVTIPQGEFEIVAMDGRRVAAVRFRRLPAGAAT
ncbi:MAG TPA: hemolysin family protein [Gemmatimonadaceae bacterium]|nr:hemolysin family protein [Gemmatimonadaceae bacterium]